MKNLKIQNGRHFWRDKNSCKKVLVNLWRYPVGQTLCRNRSISHGFRDISIFVFFAKNAKIQNGRKIWLDKIFWGNCDGYSGEIPCGSQISSKSLYLARFSRYKHFCVLQFLRKIRKFKIFLKIAMATWQRYPVGQKFHRNRSI